MTDPVSIPLGPDKWNRKLTRPWVVRWKMDATEYKARIDEGVRAIASVPMVAYSVVPPHRIEYGAWLHDPVYRAQGRLEDTEAVVVRKQVAGRWLSVHVVSRRWSDRAFRAINDLYGVADWRSWLAYRAVRRFGQTAWDEKDASVK